MYVLAVNDESGYLWRMEEVQKKKKIRITRHGYNMSGLLSFKVCFTNEL